MHPGRDNENGEEKWLAAKKAENVKIKPVREYLGWE